MTMNVIPAAPGTYLLIANTTTFPVRLRAKIPVVGWTHVQGSVAYPICSKPYEGYPPEKAILFPDGSVSDPGEPIPFESEAEWLEGLVYVEPDAERLERFVHVEPEVEGDIEPDTSPEAETAAHISPPIEFGDKAYKTTSFWSTPSENMVFQIEAHTPYPKDDRCEKVTRAEYYGLKKQGATSIDPHVQPSMGVEDDDAMDLV